MSFGKIIVLMLILAHLDRCARTWSAMLETTRAEEHLSRSEEFIAAAVVGEDVIAVTRNGGVRTIARIGQDGTTPLARLDVEEPFGEALVSTADSHWWYGTAGFREQQFGTLFITGDSGDTVSSTFVPHDVHAPFMWLRLEEEKPRGLLVFFKSTAEMEAREVTAAAEGRRWTFEAPPEYGLGIVWSAEPIANDRIALVTADGKAGIEERLTLRILGNEGVIATTILRTERRFDRISTAVDGRGRLAVVCEWAWNVEAAIFAPDAPGEAKWQKLGAPAENPAVLAVPDGFVAAWRDRESGRIRVQELSARGVSLDLFSTHERMPVVLRRAGDDDLLIASGSAYQRIPRNVAAAALLEWIRDVSASAAPALDRYRKEWSFISNERPIEVVEGGT